MNEQMIIDQAEAIVEEATVAPVKKIKPMPTKPGTIGYLTVDLIYGQLESGPWSKEKTQEVVALVRDEYPESAFKETHVSYYRSVMKQNGAI